MSNFFQILLKLLNIVFVVLGVIFFIIIIAGIWFFVADPLDLRPLIDPLIFGKGAEINLDNYIDKNPNLTSEQEKALELIGVDPAKIPNQITPELEDCFTEKLGIQRIKEIEASGQPSISDLLKVKSCLE